MKDAKELLDNNEIDAREYEIFVFSGQTKSVRTIADKFKVSKEDVRSTLRKIKKLQEK